jgi:hypothetical protein
MNKEEIWLAINGGRESLTNTGGGFPDDPAGIYFTSPDVQWLGPPISGADYDSAPEAPQK